MCAKDISVRENGEAGEYKKAMKTGGGENMQSLRSMLVKMVNDGCRVIVVCGLGEG